MSGRYTYAAKAVACFVMVLSHLAAPAGAAETWWQACACGPEDWFGESNWTAGVPGSSVEAYVDNGGTAEIRGGEASADPLHVGYAALGTVRQTGGTSDFGWSLSLGYSPGATGTFDLVDGTMTAYDVIAGTQGTGELTQTGGTCYAHVLRAGADVDGSGTISLGGDGRIQSSFMAYVGHYGQGELVQTGGTLAVAAGVVLGLQDTSSGSYDMQAGVLSTAQLVVGAAGTGTLRIQPAAGLTLTDRLAFGVDGRMPADSEGTVRLAGADLANLSTTPPRLTGLAGVTLVVEGGRDDTTQLEVAGEDRGPDPAGWTDNFALDCLQIGGAEVGQVELVNETTNQPGAVTGEALYVGTLTLNAGATVATGGLPLYYLNGEAGKQFFVGDANLDGTVGIADLWALADHYGLTAQVTWADGDLNGDGQVGVADLFALADHYGSGPGSAPVPEPQALALVALGGAAVIRVRRRRRPI